MSTQIQATHEFDTEIQQSPKPLAHLYKRVLVVEDDVTSEPLWEYILERAERATRMTWATSVKEADSLIQASIANRSPFDLVISDIFLSGPLTGIDLWQQYHALLPTNIILMSAIHPMKVQGYFKGLTAPIYLQKPLNMHETIETVYELLQRQPA